MPGRFPRSKSAPTIGRFLACAAAVVGLVLGLFSPVSAVAASTADTARLAAPSVTQSLSTAGEGVSQQIRPATLVGFTPGNIMSDAVFFDKSTMTAASIQSFFNSRVSNCQSGYTCLKDYRQNTPNRAADRYCNGYTGGSNESAATIIYKVSQSCGINPQVLVVMLQKEQGLVTHTWPSDWRYDAALGQGCPDTAPCDPAFRGFFYQIYGAARQMQIYAEGIYFTWYAPGNTWNIRYHPNVSCGSSPVYIANIATAALYYYTPYQPNAAALAAGYGEGNSCSAYGNRNFYNYFTDWFGSTQSSTCAPPNGGTRSATLAYTVTAASVLARIAPRPNCTTDAERLSQGTILQALRVSGSGDWLLVRTEAGNRWIARSAVTRATTAEAMCTDASGVGPASRAYVITAQATGRISPRNGCGLRVEPLGVGTVVQAESVSNSGLWLRVLTEAGPRWILRAHTRNASASDLSCVIPAGISGAQFSYVATAATALRAAPHTACGTGTPVVAAGTAMQAVAALDGWLKVVVGENEYWIDRSDTRRATEAEAACVTPRGTRAAQRTYVTLDPVTARSAPNANCATGTTSVPAHVVARAVAVDADTDWLKLDIGSGEKWVPRDSVRYATSADLVCTQPSGVRTAKNAYVITGTTPLRVGPGVACAHGGASLGAGETVRAVGAIDGWLKIVVGGQERWIDRSDTRQATTAEAVCVPPAGIAPAKLSYYVTASTTGRAGPNSGCAAGTASIAQGTIFTASAVTADKSWLRTTLSGKEVWVPAGVTRKATVAELTCPAPTGSRSAFRTYVVLGPGTVGRLAPTLGCETGSTRLSAGTVVTASEVTADGSWLKVVAESGQWWIPRADVRYATVFDTTCQPPGSTQNAKLWYRSETNTTARLAPTTDCTESAETIAQGVLVQAVEVTADRSWLKVRWGSGEKWVPMGDLVKVPTATTTSSSLNLRSGPSTSASVLTVLSEGTVVAVLASDGVWRRVQTHAGEGWVSSDFLR